MNASAVTTMAMGRNTMIINPLLIQRILAFLPLVIGLVMLMAMFAEPAMAQAMPWEGPLCKVAISTVEPAVTPRSSDPVTVHGGTNWPPWLRSRTSARTFFASVSYSESARADPRIRQA